MKRRSFIAACVALIVAPFGVKTGKATLPRIRTYTVEELQPMADALDQAFPATLPERNPLTGRWEVMALAKTPNTYWCRYV